MHRTDQGGSHASRTATISLALAVTVIIGAVAASSAAGSGVVAPRCGTTVTSGSRQDASVGFTPCPGDEPPVIHPQTVEPTPGMADVHPIDFDTAKVGDDDRTVTVDFVTGVAPCSVLDHVDVSYGADAVTITFFEGHDPGAGIVACPAIAVFERTIVTLDQPLDGRVIVDGAASADRPA